MHHLLVVHRYTRKAKCFLLPPPTFPAPSPSGLSQLFAATLLRPNTMPLNSMQRINLEIAMCVQILKKQLKYMHQCQTDYMNEQQKDYTVHRYTRGVKCFLLLPSLYLPSSPTLWSLPTLCYHLPLSQPLSPAITTSFNLSSNLTRIDQFDQKTMSFTQELSIT